MSGALHKCFLRNPDYNECSKAFSFKYANRCFVTCFQVFSTDYEGWILTYNLRGQYVGRFYEWELLRLALINQEICWWR